MTNNKKSLLAHELVEREARLVPIIKDESNSY
ncbi:hypothetical protein SAMN06295960_4737 [Paenibacillus aquistagni]|uniref:Uncharacterized protein n=1 Tax=Paenibacillus aquistagni TaxID=1852522 RepID=A0A1X7LYI5_9BACL|nr:hypothetical protein SAMN06295960_4737 [Paenibacillus aquistagni]